MSKKMTPFEVSVVVWAVLGAVKRVLNSVMRVLANWLPVVCVGKFCISGREGAKFFKGKCLVAA